MLPRIREAKHVQDYEVEMSFSDGTTARFDFRNRVVGRGGVFKPLQDVGFFSQVVVNSEAGTLVWPNGVEFCPDMLYAAATRKSPP